MELFDALILGIVEGITEFLPVSSTGHLILASSLLGIEQTDVHKTFEVVIQLGSILAVIFAFKDKIFHSLELWKRLIVGFIPTAVLGLTLYKIIKSLFAPETVAYMLVIGGVIFILVELFYKEKEHHIGSVEQISYKQAFLIGLFQSMAMVPGTSRSGATIIGGILIGLKRKTATEFSFLLAVPTMLAATAYDILKHHSEFDFSQAQALGVGFVTAFIVALAIIKWFLSFVKKHSFIPFGIYRIVVGLIFLGVVL
ncbi:undecaprenyl-diphosphate phosphatase [Hydrogenimonas thermophila]|uniref:Undecaprenyl-diphosphatase n=1 Tax=Hydrogenimonas thermophila TaxID=223786 RepID=A0A1I5MC48_9BACT|nr:undecaprenyl-diphosphate phosphatase [Hydrogenimonas thermophila]WOE70643.1 undecaprenyl-diphosphate phosphatase [Hydrogenimonas thermophila]WOE73161.1 undecaprenyl-diphosphate phosphatase [Hydrogenimonas thermophila]SFP07125.1 undecaprenyl-diphosphatase [Hydrogenimonas thermophila]